MDRLEAMSILLAVVDAGSLSAGARQLKAPLATVSRKVAELERHLGAPLVIRTRRGLSLTEEGRAYVAASRRILDDVETAERDVSGDGLGPRGTLHVTAPIVFGERHVLPQTLAFMQAQPEITVRLALVDQQVSLSEDHVDVAVRIGHLLDSALIATRVGSVRRVVCASPDYLARRGVPAQPSDLAHHDGISFQGFATAPEWRYRRDSAAFTVEPGRASRSTQRMRRSRLRWPGSASCACSPTRSPTAKLRRTRRTAAGLRPRPAARPRPPPPPRPAAIEDPRLPGLGRSAFEGAGRVLSTDEPRLEIQALPG